MKKIIIILLVIGFSTTAFSMNLAAEDKESYQLIWNVKNNKVSTTSEEWAGQVSEFRQYLMNSFGMVQSAINYYQDIYRYHTETTVDVIRERENKLRDSIYESRRYLVVPSYEGKSASEIKEAASEVKRIAKHVKEKRDFLMVLDLAYYMDRITYLEDELAIFKSLYEKYIIPLKLQVLAAEQRALLKDLENVEKELHKGEKAK